MDVLITGATGFIGRKVVAELRRAAGGAGVVRAVSRDPGGVAAALGAGVEGVGWDPASLRAACSRSHAVVNLAGESLMARRWWRSQKERIRASRVEGTRALVEALGGASPRPKVLVSASAVGYYGPRGDEALDEEAPAGGDFLAGVCAAWEAEARKAEPLGIRVVRLRIGIVLGPDGGALKQMVPPFKFFVGGPVLPGTQWMSWVHHADVVALVRFALENVSVSGAVNGTAPEPRMNREFSAALGAALGRPSWLPAPGFALRLALGQVAEVVTTGQRVLPKKAEAAGFRFRYPKLEEALGEVFAAKT